MNNKPRYATVRKYAKRELVNGNFCYAVFGAEIKVSETESQIVLAKTPEEIIYFLDSNSFDTFFEKIRKLFPSISRLCIVHR